MIRVALVAVIVITGAFAQAGEPVEIKLWPDKAPGEVKDIGPEVYLETKPGQLDVKRLTNVSEPTITVLPPAKDKSKGAAVVVAPGGGYNVLAIGHEGLDTCQWLNELGITAVLLKYRVPKRDQQQPSNLAALQDAQRAMSVLRSRAAELGIEPSRIGILGFSAGGNLAAGTVQMEKRSYEPVDDADKASHRPDFAALIYPAYLTEKGELKSEYSPTKDTPPIFMAGTADDKICNEGMPLLFLALNRANVPTEMHLYATGGHGYGMIKSEHPVSTWPDRLADWLRSRGIVEK